MQHNFTESLGKTSRNKEWFKPFYQDIWEHATNIAYIENVEWQKKGIDVRIDFEYGGWIGIEEKLRDKWYPDVALEYLSAAEYGTPGWIEKPQLSTWLAYGWKPKNRIVIIDYYELKKKWAENKDEWLDRYFIANAINEGYTTKSCCVPLSVCLDGVGHSWHGDFNFWNPAED